MNFIIPQAVKLPEFDGHDQGVCCFEDEGWTRLKHSEEENLYFEVIENSSSKIKVKGINKVPEETFNEAITFLAIQPRAYQRQITINANGLVESVHAGFDRLRMWERNYTEAKGWYWRESLRFSSIEYTNNNNGDSVTLQNYPFESLAWDWNDPSSYPPIGANDLGASLTAEELIVTIDPQPCPKLFCFSFSTGDSLNNCGGNIFIELEITLDN